jgi:hypothetical protein
MKIKSKGRSKAKADQEHKQIKGFPAEAGPTGRARCFYGDQLQPIPLAARVALVGPALAGKAPVAAL